MAAAIERSPSPTDKGLQELYDQVWASFAAEDQQHTQGEDIDRIYSVYGSETDFTSSPISPSSARSNSTRGSNASYPTTANGNSHRHSGSVSSVRRLPPTPATPNSTQGSYSSPPQHIPRNSSNISIPVSMPEPEIYFDPHSPHSSGHGPSPRPGHVSTDSYSSYSSTNSSGLLRKATATAANSGRRLPDPPGGVAGLPSSPSSTRRGRGLPDPQPQPPPHTYSSSQSYVSGSSRTASSDSIDAGHPYYGDDGGSTAHGHGRVYRKSDSSDHRSPSPSYGVPVLDVHHVPSLPPSSTTVASNKPRRQGGLLAPEALYQNEDYFNSSSASVNRVDSTGSYSNGLNAQGQPLSQQQRPYPYPIPSQMPSTSRGDSLYDAYVSYDPNNPYGAWDSAGPSSSGADVQRRPSEMLRAIAHYESGQGELGGLEEESYYGYDGASDDYMEEDFVNTSLLSNLAVQLRDKVPRGTHVKGSIPYPRAFTGKDIVSTIQSQFPRELLANHKLSPADRRRVALQVARSLQSQLFFYEVEWGGRILQDGVEDVYMFLDDTEGSHGEESFDRAELPTGVVTMLTGCYVPTCVDEEPCYAFSCPKRGNSILALINEPEPLAPSSASREWSETVPPEVIAQLPQSEVRRQTIIHKIISKEDQYMQDLDTIENVFLKPLQNAHPPIISPPQKLDDFINDVFGNILDLRECNRRLLEMMYIRQRELQYVIEKIGDVFLVAASEFRSAYPDYVGHFPLAEKRMKEEVENNPEFRIFLEQASRNQTTRQGQLENNAAPRLDLKHFLNRPSEHLQKYPVLLEAILKETTEGDADASFLKEAIDAMKDLQTFAQLRTFQLAMGKGTPGKWEWHDLVSTEVRKKMKKEEAKRQAIIFELIKGEMAYVKDLENIEVMYIQPLREANEANEPIIAPERLNLFIKDVFHNFAELHEHHKCLVDKFHQIQQQQHPQIRSITAAMFDAALNFRGAYMEYIPNYPIAAYRIDDEMANNPQFKQFVDKCVKHPDAHKLDIKNFINRPIPRLLRYELLLKGIMEETPPTHEDRKEIPQVLEVIKSLGKDTEPGVVSAKEKVELWRYNSNLVFKPGEWIDMDLLDDNRSLVHSGKLLRQPEGGIEWTGWSELYVLLFDNYLVLTKPKERDGVTKYHVNRRPIPLDLLALGSFNDAPTQRPRGIISGLRGGERHDNPAAATNSPDSAGDSRSVYPLTLQHHGRMGGPYILFAESQQARAEWKQKLEEAIGLRQVVQEANKVFEIETLSADTFLIPSVTGPNAPPAWNQDNSFTGKVTCSVPFNTADGRGLVAIGCAEGVWIGFRHDPKSMRRVLHLKMVTQCAMLEEFGIFLVLADKALFAYHIEALVPTSPHTPHTSQVPQRLSGNKDVHFFSVGQLHGRTLVIYMKKKGLDSIFRVLEPVGDKINERAKAPTGLGSRFFRPNKSEWFRIYRDFFLPSESFDLIFLKARIVILCIKGFEIMDLNDFKSVTIPQRDDARLAQLAKRCDSCRPIGMFRSADDEFLLCYDEFGLYVDKHGDPSRAAGTIEWEGTAERVALHSPYILLFDQRFIEIRHLETGRLVQIISGTDIRCIWDGRGAGPNNHVMTTPIHDGRDEPVVQEAQVHAVMNAPDSGPRTRTVVQEVFQLVPTVPLYIPEPLPQSHSSPPPPSPQQVRTSMSWRP
ncbi:signal transducer [Moniliophthora roreri MCA 2997]|uniref:Signal transducer n=1 Tax=Moniliophthora roreri (strain MCA 2997) TaxID=1381753 RepID=V2WAL1_MONRO|nr:signal transducer [Moniliophthora roreri MCA 2997]